MRHACVAFSSAVLIAASSQNQAPETRLDLIVRADFFAGMFGDTARLDRGMRYTEDILRHSPRDHPRHAQALVWHGGGLCTRASNSWAAGQDSP